MTYFNKYQPLCICLFVIRKSFIVKLLLIKVSGRYLVNLQGNINIELLPSKGVGEGLYLNFLLLKYIGVSFHFLLLQGGSDIG